MVFLSFPHFPMVFLWFTYDRLAVLPPIPLELPDAGSARLSASAFWAAGWLAEKLGTGMMDIPWIHHEILMIFDDF